MYQINTSILIVDDAIENRMLLKAILEEKGYTIHTAKNGIEARGIAKREQPGIILMDIMMPDENGFETCKKLKQSAATADIPIIFISSLNDSENIVKGLTVGGIDYISKPFNQEEVSARVRNYLRLRNNYLHIIHEQANRLRQIQDAQQSILVKPDDLPDAGFGVVYTPILEAGGDFYDVFEIKSGVFGYFVADISGHDLGASFATSALKALIRQNASPLYKPDEIFRMINAVLMSIFSGGQHLTAAYINLDRKTSELELVNAAHLPVLYLPVDKEPKWLETEGDILGVFDTALYTCLTVHVTKGDRLFLFTDGLLESFQGEGRSREQGMAELAQYARDTRDLDIQAATSRITNSILENNPKKEDDIVLLGIAV